MARKVSQTDPALAIEFFLSGFYTHRSQLFAPFKGIGVNVVSFHDPVIDGQNMEDTDLYEWTRRPGFSIFCSQSLPDTEIVKNFYSSRDLLGNVHAFFDSTVRLATFTSTQITSLITKATSNEGFLTTVGNWTYFSDGAAADLQKWNPTFSLSTTNPSPWGIAAPTTTPTLYSQGCWLPFRSASINTAILDPNGSVEVVTAIFGSSGITGSTEPIWPTTTSSSIRDGSVQWTNMGPLLTWLPAAYYPVPVVVLDPNGNLQLATNVSPTVAEWNATTNYPVGTVVAFAGLYWASLISNTGIAPTSNYTVTTVSGSTSTTQPYWVQTLSPSLTGVYPTTPYVPPWNKTVGGSTADGNYEWTNLGPGILVESFGTSYVYCYRTIFGELSTASPVSANTGSIFGPQIVTITSFSITNNLVTFQGQNNFIPGNVFSVEGLTVGTYLNGQTFIVQAGGLTSTSFTAAFTYSNVSSTADSGTTVNLIAALSGAGTSSLLCNAQVAITATQVQNGIVTIYAQNTFVGGLWMTFTGLTVATFLNNQQLQIIAVDPNGTWFQVYYTTSQGALPPNQSQTTDTGTATFNAVEIYRVSDGGGIFLFTGAVTNLTSSTTVTPYDSGFLLAGSGTDNGIPGTYVWSNPNNVTNAVSYATTTIPAPVMSGSGRFNTVQTCQTFALDSANPYEATFAAPVTSGNSILVFTMQFLSSSGSVSPADNQGNTYTKIAQTSLTNSDGAIEYLAVWMATGVSGGTTIVYIPTNNSRNSWAGFIAAECSGLAGTYETPVYAAQQSGTSLAPGSITILQANEVVVSFVWSDLGPNSNQPAEAPSGYTPIGSQVLYTLHGDTFTRMYQQITAVFQVETATGTFAPQWYTPANRQGMGITMSLPLYVYNVGDGLSATQFDFRIPTGIDITGIVVSFNASFNGTNPYGVVEVQLLQGGAPVGNTITVPLQVGTGIPYTLGGAGNVWGVPWTPSAFNSAWGVRFIATQLVGGTNATFGINNVQARVLGNTSSSWVYYDFTADADLNALLIAPQGHLNDPPPGSTGSLISTTGTITAYWNGRLWMVVGNYVYFDAGPDCTNGIPESAWPPSNRFQFAGPPFALEPTPDGTGLLVYLADRVNAILGGPETISFYATDALSNFGISNPNAIFKDGSVIGQFTTQQQYLDLIGGDKRETGEHIADYLTEYFSAASTYATFYRQGLDTGIFLSNGTNQVLRFGSNISAWSVPAYPVCGAGALRAIETSVGMTSLMLASPTGGITTKLGPWNPTSGTSVGSGTAWSNPSNITAGSPTSYATVSFSAAGSSQQLLASLYPTLNIPSTAVVQGVQVTVVGYQTGSSTLQIAPNNPVSGATTHIFQLGQTQTTLTFGSSSDLWGMPWNTPADIRVGPAFTIVATAAFVAPPTIIGSTTVANASQSVGNFQLTLTGITAGDVLLVFACANPVAISGVPTDSQSNTWTTVFSQSNATDEIACYIATASASGSITVSVPVSETCSIEGSLVDVSNCMGVDVYATTGSSAIGPATLQEISSGITSSGPEEVVLAFVGSNQSSVYGISYTQAGTMALVGQATNTSSLTEITGIGAVTTAAGTYALSISTPSISWTEGSELAVVSIMGGAGFGTVTGAGWTSAYSDSTDAVLTQTLTSGSTSFSGSAQYGFSWTGILLSLLGSGSNTPTVRSSTYGVNNGSGGPATTTVPTMVTGDAVLVFVNAFGSTSATNFSVSDSESNTYTFIQSAVESGGTGPDLQAAFIAFPVTGGSNVVITVSAQNDSALRIIIVEFYNVGALINASGALLSQTLATAGSITPEVTASSSILYRIGAVALKGTNSAPSFAISEVQMTVWYQNPGNYLYARDINSWGDCGAFGENDGISYEECYITIGSITLSQPGAVMFPLQHLVGYFDAVGTLGEHGAPSQPNVWILPNEINATAGIGFVQLPEVLPEPPQGQNKPSETLLALRWPINMMNSELASQFIHHLQVKIEFDPENAPNTIKAIAFKENQE